MSNNDIIVRRIKFDNDDYLLVAGKDTSIYRKKLFNIEDLVFDFDRKEGRLIDKIFNKNNLVNIDVYSIKNKNIELNKIFEDAEHIDSENYGSIHMNIRYTDGSMFYKPFYSPFQGNFLMETSVTDLSVPTTRTMLKENILSMYNKYNELNRNN